MNDYLSNLSARSFAQTEGIPLVMPRVPSLFEPSQGVWSDSAEIHSWPSRNHRPNDDASPSSSSKTGEESKELKQAIERPSNKDTAPDMMSEDVPYLHRRRMQTLKGASERDTRDNEPAVKDLPEPDRRTVILKQTSAKPSEDRSPQSTIQDDIQEPATDKTIVLTAVRMAPASKENSRSVSVQIRREEGSTQPPNKSRKERLDVEKVMAKERVEGIISRDVPLGEEGGEQHNVITPLTIQQPLQYHGEPAPNPWKNPGYREAPAKVEPIIHVTIGRIEVRAMVSPQKHTGKSEKTTSVMGLEEYLRRRSGGRDR